MLFGHLRPQRGYALGQGVADTALGQMKLVMPNSYNVYLHDTPNKKLFEQPIRAFSHGCIRVDKALTLAAALLGRPVDVEAASGKTATVAPSRQVEFHTDIYDRDRHITTGAAPKGECLN